MSVPVPAPVLDAMREWYGGEVHKWRGDAEHYAHEFVRHQTDAYVIAAVERDYPGGVAAFLRDHGNEGGEDAR